MRKPSMLVTVFAAAVVAALSAMGACSSPDGVTPDCKFNVGGNGLVPVTNGCEGFAPCVVNGKTRPAAECCVDDKGAALTGDDLNVCLAGYGAPTVSTSSSSSSSGGGGSTSSSSSSASSSSGDGGA